MGVGENGVTRCGRWLAGNREAMPFSGDSAQARSALSLASDTLTHLAASHTIHSIHKIAQGRLQCLAVQDQRLTILFRLGNLIKASSVLSTCLFTPLANYQQIISTQVQASFQALFHFHSGFIAARSLVPRVSAGMMIATQAPHIRRTVRR